MANSNRTTTRKSSGRNVSRARREARGCIAPPAAGSSHLNKTYSTIWTVIVSFHNLIQTGVQFLLVDLDLAMTFMDIGRRLALKRQNIGTIKTPVGFMTPFRISWKS